MKAITFFLHNCKIYKQKIKINKFCNIKKYKEKLFLKILLRLKKNNLSIKQKINKERLLLIFN